MTTPKRETVRAVYDDDLVRLLQQLGVYGDFVHGKVHCFHCRDVMTDGNLYAVFPDSGQVKMACHRPACVAAISERRSAA